MTGVREKNAPRIAGAAIYPPVVKTTSIPLDRFKLKTFNAAASD